jgi:hypothetical protein
MNEQPMMLIPVDLAQKIADYLGQRPFHDVVHLMMALSQLKPAPNVTELSQPIHSVAESHATE